MTLPASGQIDFSQVNTELSLSATAAISLNDAAVRGLFGVASGAISMSDGWGKSSVLQGGLWTWGTNSNGQLAQGDVNVNRSSPVQAGSLTNWVSFSGSAKSFVAVKSDGTMWACGYNNTSYLLGTGDTTPRSSPVQLGSLTTWASVGSAGNSQMTGYAIKTDGTLWTWGNASSGQCGTNSVIPPSVPTQVGTLTNWKQVQGGSLYGAALKTDGTLWAWGIIGNAFGYIASTSSPVQVGNVAAIWKQMTTAGGSTNSWSLAIRTDGTLWAWGNNSFGQLGNGSTTAMTNTGNGLQIGTLTNWAYVHATNNAASTSTSLALKTNGTLWAWGANADGQLGLGDLIPRSSPVQVGSLTNWKYVTSYADPATSLTTVFAIKTDGTLWAWGNNATGQTGIGNFNVGKYSSPVQIGSLTTWKNLMIRGPIAVIK